MPTLPFVAAAVVLLADVARGQSAPLPGPSADSTAEPRAVFAPGIGYDVARSRLIVFGGEGDGRQYSGDTWEFDGARWARVAATGPSPRVWSALAYDAGRRRTVLFGGADASGALGDTWEFDGTTWHRMDARGPAPRFAHEMTFDSRRGRVILFGGRGATALDDTWEWDGVSWQRAERSAPRPPGRFTHALTHDAARGTMLLFGGYGRAPGAAADGSLGDLWSFTDGRWTPRATGGSMSGATDGPPARDHVTMVFDEARGRLVLHGGGGGGGSTPRTPYADTWEFDGDRWRRAATTGPGITGNHRLVYDHARRRVVLWTGVAGDADRTELWEWDGAAWTSRWRSATPSSRTGTNTP